LISCLAGIVEAVYAGRGGAQARAWCKPAGPQLDTAANSRRFYQEQKPGHPGQHVRRSRRVVISLDLPGPWLLRARTSPSGHMRFRNQGESAAAIKGRAPAPRLQIWNLPAACAQGKRQNLQARRAIGRRPRKQRPTPCGGGPESKQNQGPAACRQNPGRPPVYVSTFPATPHRGALEYCAGEFSNG